ncbi:MAG: RNA polymerase sigma factor [Bacteroidota bacterium]
MKNPLSDTYSEEVNKTLVRAALEGDRKAMDQLIRLHQPFIYNVAWKMAHDPNDAMDLTQETLLKVITKLAQFNFKSSFRTWLYRIVVNEFLQTKRRKGEQQFTSFEENARQLDAIPNPDLTVEEEIEFAELSKEMQVRCLSGMLMCLNREQRLIYILGDVFAVDHNLGAEIFQLSPQNFRVKLYRARKDLKNYMNDKCGLINKENPCRCPKKAKALKQMGMLDERTMLFNITTKTKIADYVEGQYINVRNIIEDKYSDLYRQHPAKDNFDKATVVEELLNDQDLMERLQLN